MRDPFARAAKTVLASIGKDGLLRGAPAGKVHVEQGVEVYERNHEGEAVFSRSIATFEKQYAPKRGDALDLLDDQGTVVASYKLDRVFEDNGFCVRHIVLPV